MKKPKQIIGVCTYCKGPIYKGQHYELLDVPLRLKFSNKNGMICLLHKKVCLKKQVDRLFKEFDIELKFYEGKEQEQELKVLKKKWKKHNLIK